MKRTISILDAVKSHNKAQVTSSLDLGNRENLHKHCTYSFSCDLIGRADSVLDSAGHDAMRKAELLHPGNFLQGETQLG